MQLNPFCCLKLTALVSMKMMKDSNPGPLSIDPLFLPPVHSSNYQNIYHQYAQVEFV